MKKSLVVPGQNAIERNSDFKVLRLHNSGLLESGRVEFRKILSVIFGLILLFAAITIPAQAGSMGGGMGDGMTGNWGDGMLNWLQGWQNGRGDTPSPNKQSEQMGELNKQHYEDSVYL
jgi:hypothetical protein